MCGELLLDGTRHSVGLAGRVVDGNVTSGGDYSGSVCGVCGQLALDVGKCAVVSKFGLQVSSAALDRGECGGGAA